MSLPPGVPEMYRYYFTTESVLDPPYAPFFGLAGIFSAMVFSTVGAAYGTVRSGIAIGGIGQFRPDLVMKALIPVVMSGILAVYGLVVSVLISQDIHSPGPNKSGYTLFAALLHLGAGLSVGLCGACAGYAIGMVGESGVRALMSEPRVYIGMVLILIFSEVLGLYGLIVALIMNTKAQG